MELHDYIVDVIKQEAVRQNGELPNSDRTLQTIIASLRGSSALGHVSDDQLIDAIDEYVESELLPKVQDALTTAIAEIRLRPLRQAVILEAMKSTARDIKARWKAEISKEMEPYRESMRAQVRAEMLDQIKSELRQELEPQVREEIKRDLLGRLGIK